MGFLLYAGFLLKVLSDSYVALSRRQIILPMLFILGVIFMFTNIQGIYNKSLYFFFAFIIVTASNAENEEVIMADHERAVKTNFIQFN